MPKINAIGSGVKNPKSATSSLVRTVTSIVGFPIAMKVFPTNAQHASTQTAAGTPDKSKSSFDDAV